VLRYVLSEDEFLSPYGIRSMSKVHLKHPFSCEMGGRKLTVAYEPAEGKSRMFGGNSNWRGPVWLPMNYLLVEALERYHRFYGDDFEVEMPTGSGRRMNLLGVAQEIERRLSLLFLKGADGRRPCMAAAPGGVEEDPASDRVLFHEYFDGGTGRGLGASHQTGWTALIAQFLERRAVACDD
jgi:Glycosyl hydrolase family 63 C-terminal domain